MIRICKKFKSAGSIDWDEKDDRAIIISNLKINIFILEDLFLKYKIIKGSMIHLCVFNTLINIYKNKDNIILNDTRD